MIFTDDFYRWCDALLSEAEVSESFKRRSLIDHLNAMIYQVEMDDPGCVDGEYYYEIVSRLGELS